VGKRDAEREAKRNSLGFHRLPLLADRLRDVVDLHGGVGLHDAQQILLEERVVQRGEVGTDRWIRGELYNGKVCQYTEISRRSKRR
jgi:hypothetical protein